MVAHFLNFPVMVPDPCIQLFHEEAMFLPIVHRAEKINMKNECILQSNQIQSTLYSAFLKTQDS